MLAARPEASAFPTPLQNWPWQVFPSGGVTHSSLWNQSDSAAAGLMGEFHTSQGRIPKTSLLLRRAAGHTASTLGWRGSSLFHPSAEQNSEAPHVCSPTIPITAAFPFLPSLRTPMLVQEPELQTLKVSWRAWPASLCALSCLQLLWEWEVTLAPIVTKRTGNFTQLLGFRSYPPA